MNEPGTTGNGCAARAAGGKTLSLRAQASPARPASLEGREELGQLIRPLAMSAMFMRPAYLAQSAWLEHVPFAFWLVEAHQPRVIVELGTHRGVSYFALCQAVERLGLAARCYAVDSWKGDAHAGFYGEEVFEQVRAHNDAHYSGFSRLVRSSFDEALDHFSAGTIDLLHIDGLHTIEAVRHDFESWLPKLSERAVVVLHDSNVRERGFGVFRLVEQLRQQYPCFEFVHGHGLAVLGIGAEQSEHLERLFAVSDHEAGRHAVQEMFARLGRATADAHAVQERASTARALEAAVSTHKTEIENLGRELNRTKRALEERVAKAKKTRARLEREADRNAAERGRLAERATMLRELRDNSRHEAARLAARADRAATELKKRTDALIALKQRVREQERRLSEARVGIARERAATCAARAQLHWHGETLAAAQGELERMRTELAVQCERAEKAQSGLEAERLGRAAAEHAVEMEKAAAAEAAKRHLDELARQEARVRAAEAERDQFRAEATRQAETARKTRSELDAERAARATAEQALQKEKTAGAEGAKRHREELARQESRLRAAETERDQLRAEAENSARKLEERFGELARLTRRLRDVEVQSEQQKHQLEAIRKARQATVRLLGRAIVALGRYNPDHPPRAAKLQRLAGRLKEAGVFDPDWYLERNGDVSAAGLDPVRHYLLYGVREGREPRDITSLLADPEQKGSI